MAFTIQQWTTDDRCVDALVQHAPGQTVCGVCGARSRKSLAQSAAIGLVRRANALNAAPEPPDDVASDLMRLSMFVHWQDAR